ncbi:Heme chaperone HemW [Stackebrandtia soli]
MPSALPEGEPAPRDGALPAAALDGMERRDFGVYVHVPFCASRCGYCDFNTYTAAELGGGASRDNYLETLAQEFALAKRVAGGSAPPASTIFVGGGTPTLLRADELTAIVSMVADTFGLTDDAEVTTEANPESVDAAYLSTLRRGGFTRLSLGMQSTSRHVLSILDRDHTPGRALDVARTARDVGFDHVNLDLIYGTPGETPDDFAASVRAAIDVGADHVSAYALIVEDGTALARRIRRGDLPYPSDDVAADRYLAAERLLTDAGLTWYEVSNWATTPVAQCRHNLLYWRSDNWWGFGPGAHSHIGGLRWWNVKHPSRYARQLEAGESPAAGRETLTSDQRYVETVMLRTRLREGLAISSLNGPGRDAARDAVERGLLDEAAFTTGRAILTLRGRLLADAVVRDLID